MKSRIKRVLGLIVFLCLFAFSGQAVLSSYAAPSSGTCGDDLTWTLSDEGTLTISGKGQMYDYVYNNRPWCDVDVDIKDNIKSVVIDNGVESIGNCAFSGCTKISSVSIPEGVTSISENVFFMCIALKNVTIPESVTSIGSGAFGECASLESVIIPESVKNIGENAFNSCSSLTEVTILSGSIVIGKDAFANDANLKDVYFAGTEEQWNSVKGAFPNTPSVHYIEKELTITVLDQTYKYDGDPHGEADPVYDKPEDIAGKVTVEGLEKGDSLTMIVLFGQATNVGVYKIEITGFNTLKGKDIYIPKLNPGTLTIGYEVTVTPGANMTKTAGSGELLQIAAEDINPVVFTADEGYYFPGDYKVDAVNGIRVTRDSESQITAAGMPTSGAAITLPDAILKTFTVTFADEDGAQLQTVEVRPNGVPAYPGELPLKASTDEHTYVFAGWKDAAGTVYTGQLPAVTGAVTYTASYSESDRAYTGPEWSWAEDLSKATATFTAADDETYQISLTTAGIDEQTTVKPDCTDKGEVTYTAEVTFLGQTYTDEVTEEIDALGHDWGEWKVITEAEIGKEGEETRVCSRCGETETKTIPALDEPETYTVTFVDEDGTELQSSILLYGETPEYTGKTPIREADAQYTYEFAGWNPEITGVTADVTYTAVYIAAAIPEPAPEPSKNKRHTEKPFPFTDVPEDAYFRKAVEWGWKNDILAGTSQKTFSPYETATRAQMIAFVWAASGAPEPETAESPFQDIAETDYFYKAVLWAYENGITSGVSADLFGPDQTVTRGQAATFLYNAAGRPEAGEEPFGDVNEGDYFQAAVAWAYGEGITAGTGATAFSPDEPCLRCQIVTFLYLDFAE